jgi:YD repeat-containing protein
VTYAYTARGQLASVSDWQSHTTSYTYDSAGHQTSVTLGNRISEVDNGTSTTTYGYDALNRWLSANYPNGDALSYGTEQHSRPH